MAYPLSGHRLSKIFEHVKNMTESEEIIEELKLQ